MNALQRLRQGLASPFALRVAALFLGLLALVQIASFSAIRSSLHAQAYRELPAELAVAERVMLAKLSGEAEQRAQRARLFGADYGFHTVLRQEPQDADTLRSVLEDNAVVRTGADEAAYLGTDLALRAASGSRIGQLAPLARSLVDTAAREGSAGQFVQLGGQPHLAVLAPVRPANEQQALLGWILLSFPLDPALIDDMRFLSKRHFTLLARDGGGGAWHSVLSSLAPATATALASALPAAPGTNEMNTLKVAGEQFGLRARPLDGRGIAGTSLVGVVSASIDEATQLPIELQRSLLQITLAAFGVFAIGSLYTARRVTHPLSRLAQAAERLGAGDYSTPMGGVGRGDEVGELAQSFERMRVNVAEKQAQIERLAYWDPLTGLPNRAQFGDAVRAALDAARGTEAPVAVLMLDLARFKNINAKLGYAVGDRLLRSAAQRLARQVLREGDLVARRGGGEFAVLLRTASPELAQAVAQRIARAFEQPLSIDDHRLDLSVGVGIACWPLHATDADALVNRAELAMYAAKRRHAGPLVYEPGMDDSSTQSLSLLSELREAVARDELRLHLQPKLSLATGAVVGAEALVRWQHPVRGMVPPGQFIPFAEQTGFIRELTLWVFAACAKAWREMRAEGCDMVLSVNLSARDLLDTDLPTKLEKRLLEHRVPAEAFCLEITESAVMDDPERALRTLKRLSLMGFKLSIDDFGSGMSSYGYLKQLPVDELKIDMVFVRNMDRDPVDVKLVRSMVELAHNLGLGVVAEGVENARSWDLLRELNCDQAQGYHMGKPMPLAEFLAWSARWVDKRRMTGAMGSAGLLH